MYGAVVAYFMQNPKKVPYWRRLTWLIFSIIFFIQLFLGIIGFEKFLMTGKLHLPVPSMILMGPIYREQISFMTILFLSTIILSGPAWCSHLCYFGAIDNFTANPTGINKALKHKKRIKHILFLLIIIIILIFKAFRITTLYATIAGILFGTIGLFIIIFLSGRKGKMYHCIYYCPIGTIVNYLRYINPFRLRINKNCTFCWECSSVCKYDALNKEDIKNKKPGITCTLCGDCIYICESQSIYYKFFSLSPHLSRNIYLVITISLHAVFLALARM